MSKEFIKTQMKVKDNLVNVMRVGNIDYISLTDLARYKNPLTPGDVIIKWMSNKSSFDFYCLWEELSNPNFKLAESREFKIDSATQSFTISPSRCIKETNAIGLVSKRGKYEGGTFAYPDIAFEFASWIDSAFNVILVNLENLNAQMIKDGLKQKDRLEKLNTIAKEQYIILHDNNSIEKIKMLDDKNNLKKLE